MIVSHETFLDILEKWNKKINLVRYDSREELIKRHIEDSAQLSKYLRKDDKIIDVGSGAGFPGLILAMLDYEVTLVESDERKCAFLQYVIQELQLAKVDLINDRIEGLELKCDVLTCRGFSKLKKIFEFTSNIEVRRKYLLLKGKNYMNEINETKKEWLFRYDLHDSISSDEGKILEIYDLIKHDS